MSDPSKYNSFTAADIERYYNGQMPAAERHALEKAALDDPFLADALEGYAFTSAPVADISALKERLRGEKKKRNGIPLSYKWLQVAALFLILAGSGWFLYKADFFSKKEIAVAAPARPEQPENFSAGKLNDSAGVANTAPVQDVAPKADQVEKAVTHAPGNKPARQKKQTQAAGEKQEAKKTAPALTMAVEPQKDLIETRRSGAGSARLKKEVAVEAPRTEKNNEIPAYDKAANSNTDSVSGYAALQGKVAGVQTSGDTVKLNVTMQRSKENLNEVVVVHMGAQKNAKARPVAKFEELEPAQGWTNFNEYIAQNLQQPEDLKEKAVSGDVELSFEVNKEGEAVNIKVERSLCGKCDEEAVRLLKEGPKWKKKKDKKGRVTIHF